MFNAGVGVYTRKISVLTELDGGAHLTERSEGYERGPNGIGTEVLRSGKRHISRRQSFGPSHRLGPRSYPSPSLGYPGAELCVLQAGSDA